VIDDVDLTIAALLEHELAPEILTQAAITFATPDDSFPPAAISLPAIDLFLYDMRENRDLRTGEWRVELDEYRTGLTRERPPVRIDCTYLVTAWPSDSSMTPALDEHHLLGATLTALLRHPVLPEAVLQGALANAETDVPTAMLHQGQGSDMAAFWQALGGRPRAAFGYTVTIAVQAFDLVPAGKPVRDKQIDFDMDSPRPNPPAGP
jgi:hypothetical protein